jgi:AcrR family transcriptional regulator
MVSQRPRLDRSSRGRLLAAAATEFAARGFDGAKVDRIAARARVNKAMVYYHFENKADLYRAILHDTFQGIAAAVAAARAAGGPPGEQLVRYVRTLAAESATRPHFAALWLREMAEGGRHLDQSIVADLGAILGVLAGILGDGRASGAFRDVHPFVAQIGIVAPLLLFTASAPLRERFQGTLPGAVVDRDVMIAHVETSARAAVAATARPGAARPGAGRPASRFRTRRDT